MKNILILLVLVGCNNDNKYNYDSLKKNETNKESEAIDSIKWFLYEQIYNDCETNDGFYLDIYNGDTLSKKLPLVSLTADIAGTTNQYFEDSIRYIYFDYYYDNTKKIPNENPNMKTQYSYLFSTIGLLKGIPYSYERFNRTGKLIQNLEKRLPENSFFIKYIQEHSDELNPWLLKEAEKRKILGRHSPRHILIR
jgi:hypothetical protein